MLVMHQPTQLTQFDNGETVDKHLYKYYLFNDTTDFIHDKSCLQHKVIQITIAELIPSLLQWEKNQHSAQNTWARVNYGIS